MKGLSSSFSWFVDTLLIQIRADFVDSEGNRPKKCGRNTYPGDYIYFQTRAHATRNGFCNPTPLISSILAQILLAFYLLTYSQLGSLSSTTDARPANLAPSPKRWDNPSLIHSSNLTLPLTGETFGLGLVALHDG